MIDTSMARPAAHYCDLPKIEVWEHSSGSALDSAAGEDWRPPHLVSCLLPGTRFKCPCGKVWVVTHIPSGFNGKVGWPARREWQRETFWQRQQRLWKRRR